MLKVESLSYKIGHKYLLEDISMSLEPGKLNLIIGPNGAGKSTLIKAICNQLEYQQGSVFYGDKNIRQSSFLELAKVRSVLSQTIDLTFPLKVWEVVMMGRYPHFTGQPSEKDEQACQEAMRYFDVWEMADRDYTSLSGGEKQRVNFARVMTQIWHPSADHCRYLILDEPLTFLDVHYQFQFMHQLVDLLKDPNLIVVGVVHDLNLAAKFADHIVLLHNARVLASGNKSEVLTAENIRTAYQLEPIIYMADGHFHLFFN